MILVGFILLCIFGVLHAKVYDELYETPLEEYSHTRATLLILGCVTSLLLGLGAVLVALAGVARADVFDAPTKTEQQAERERCERSAVCRALIDDRPAVLFEALSDEAWCVGHATNAEKVLRAKGIPTRLEGAHVDGVGHVYIVATVNGKEWVVDNGALPWCDRVCTLAEARHGQ